MNFSLMMNNESPAHINNNFDFQENTSTFDGQGLLGASPGPTTENFDYTEQRIISEEENAFDPNSLLNKPMPSDTNTAMIEEPKSSVQLQSNDNPEVKAWFIFKTNQLRELITTHLCTSKKKEEEELYFDSGLMFNAINSTHNPEKNVLVEILFSFFKNQLRSLELKCAKKKKFIQDLKKFEQKLEKDKSELLNPTPAQPKTIRKNEEKFERKKLKKVKDLLDSVPEEPSLDNPETQSQVNNTSQQAASTIQKPVETNIEKPVPVVTEKIMEITMNKTIEPDHMINTEYYEYDGPRSIAHTRARRNVKKPVYTYENKIVEEKLKSGKKTGRRDRGKPEPLSWKPPENTNMVSREDLANSWRDWELHFHHLISGLTQEEFLLLIQKIWDSHPHCISFDNGHLELIINAERMEAAIGNRDDARANQMRNQLQTYQIFTKYVNEIKEKKRQEEKAEVKTEMKIEPKSEVKSEAQYEGYVELNPEINEIKTEEKYEIEDEIHIPFLMDENIQNEFKDFNFS